MTITAVARTRPSRLSRARRSLATNDFLLLWSGQTVSKIGNGAYKVAMAWSVYQISKSTAAMGLVLALNVVPEVVLAMLGGTIADRISRRTVIIVADLIAAFVTLGLAVASAVGTLSIGLLMVGAFLLGVVSAFYGPAYAALKGQLPGVGGRGSANAWFTVSGNLARLTGPALAGMAFAVGGAGTVFGLDAATFAFAVITTYLVKVPAASKEPATPSDESDESESGSSSAGREMLEGFTYTVKAKWLLITLAISLVANVACLAPYAVLLPDLVTVHGSGIGVLGLLCATEIGVGIVGAIVIGRMSSRLRPGTAMFALCGLLGVGTLVLGLAGGHTPLLFAGVALIGLGLSFDVIEQTLLQSLVPDRLLARVYAVNTVISYSLLPVGYTVAGLVSGHTGAAPVLTVGGVALIAACGLAAPHPEVRRLNTVAC